MIEARGFKFTDCMKMALINSGFASIKPLRNFKEEDIEEIKRCIVDSSAWKLGDVRQLQQLCLEIADKEAEFLTNMIESIKETKILNSNSLESTKASDIIFSYGNCS